MYIKDRIKNLKKEQKMLEKIYLKYPQTQEFDSFSERSIKYYFIVNSKKLKFDANKYKYFINNSLETNYFSIILVGNNLYETHINDEEKLIFITNLSRLAFSSNTADKLSINIENFDLDSRLMDKYINYIKEIIFDNYEKYIELQYRLRSFGKNVFKPFKVSVSSKNGKVKKYFSKIIKDYLKTIEVFI